MNYKVTHKTEYIYHEPVSLCHNIARLVPRTTEKQFCKSASISIIPQPEILNQYDDFFGNKVVYFAIEKEHKKLTVTVYSEIEKTDSADMQIINKNISWEDVIQTLLQLNEDFNEVKQYIPETAMTASDENISAYVLQSFTPGRPAFEAVQDLMRRIFTDFKFTSGLTTIATPLSVVMKQRKGVCQDFAHLAIACIRSVGLPARYVSGYIETLSPRGAEKLIGVDASHAWFSVYIPETGWVDFDPTNNIIPSDQHITIGWGRDYADITPLKGIIMNSGPHKLQVSVDVKGQDNI
jgi:transglutaminase-like putative cysteine protease